jgi:hypothetical protein
MELKIPKPSMFIGSSNEGYDTARAIQAILKDDADITLWRNGVFGLNQGTLESLVKAADTFDFAILVLTPDDVTESRDVKKNSPRDNVLFEAGLFMGRLGRERAFIIHPNNVEMKLPSDLAGVTVATYEQSANIELRDAVSAGCYDIINAVKKLGKIGKVIPISDHSLASTLDGLMRNISAGMKIEQSDFRGEIIFHCREWQSISRDWAQGKIVVRQNYENLLANIYRSAKRTIFSTSIPQYQKTWTSQMGKSLIRIQEKNNAKSTRVFIFDARDDITNDDNQIFEEHSRAGIEVIIYFDREDPTFLFPADVGTDWTIVDEGSAIGVTRQMGELYEAQWYFNDRDQSERFLDFEQRLRAGSISIDQWRGQ